MRTWVIADLIWSHRYRTYLEIGVATGANICSIARIPRLRIVGVDPDPQCEHVTHPVDSDTFFAANEETFDMVFIDGCHLEAQVDRDIANALSVLNEGGTIVIHDCNPATYEHGTENHLLDEWNGTVWRSAVKLRCANPTVTLRVVDVNYGCGILTREPSKPYMKSDVDTCLDWEYFDVNRTEILNLISYEDFTKLYLRQTALGRAVQWLQDFGSRPAAR